MIKVLFDLTGWQTNGSRGIGRYTINFAQSLVQHNDIDLSFIYTKRWNLTDLPPVITEYPIYSFEDGLTDRFDFLILSDPLCHDIDTLATSIKNCDSITTIFYDLIPLIFAKDYLKTAQTRLDYIKCLESLKVIDHFFCISNSTEQDLQSYLSIPSYKTSCIYGGADVSKFAKCTNFIKRHDLVMVPGDDLRKNYIRGCEAFAISLTNNAIPSDSRLRIICGCGQTFRDNIKNCLKSYPTVRIGKEVLIEGYVEDSVLIEAVSSATATIFPSLYEGLGLPIIESFAAGTPCISSNTSSCAELNISECQFNPKSVEDISNKINEIFNSQTLREKCVNFGKKLVLECSWKKTTEKVIHTLKNFKKHKLTRIAMFGGFPPSASGIATYNKLIADSTPDTIDLFGDNKSIFSYYSDLTKSAGNTNIFPECSYYDLALTRNYTAHIYALGNSEHNLSALEAAIRIKSNNSWLYLHEGELISLIKPYCQKEGLDVKTLYFSIYGDKKNHSGIKVIQHLTGIKNFLVNTDKCADMIKKELKNIDGIVLKKLFLPIKNRMNTTTIKTSEAIAKVIYNAKKSGHILIGTFGIPNDQFKGCNIIIKAVEQARTKYPKIQLIMAGYHVNRYLSEHTNLDISPFSLTFDAPTDDDLTYIMSQIDIAVQLRPHSIGEASGVISELACYGKDVIVTQGFTNGYNEAIFTQISPDADKNEVCDAIISVIMSKSTKNHHINLDQYSTEQFIEQLKNAVS